MVAPECTCVVNISEIWDGKPDSEKKVENVELIQCPLCRSAPALLEALETLEWAGSLGEMINCPSCFADGGCPQREHDNDCKLAIALKQARGELST